MIIYINDFDNFFNSPWSCLFLENDSKSLFDFCFVIMYFKCLSSRFDELFITQQRWLTLVRNGFFVFVSISFRLMIQNLEEWRVRIHKEKVIKECWWLMNCNIYYYLKAFQDYGSDIDRLKFMIKISTTGPTTLNSLTHSINFW